MIIQLFRVWLMLSLGLLSTNLYAFCQQWSEAEKIGRLNHEEIPEASGLAVSRQFPDRLYHINDAGSTGSFYLTDLDGRNEQRVKLVDFSPVDTEGLGLGSCDRGGDSCLFVADMGDNDAERSHITIVLIREKEDYAKAETPLRKLQLRYPDGSHNAEGFAVHPNGDIFIVTKGETTAIYKLSASEWQDHKDRSKFELQRVGRLDIAALSSGKSKKSVVTSFDISPDGESFLLLTYAEAFEFNINLAAVETADEFDVKQLKRSGRLHRIEVDVLKKQEGIAYMTDGNGFYYTTESKKKDAVIMQVSCKA